MKIDRRSFVVGAGAAAIGALSTGESRAAEKGEAARIKFGACCGMPDVPLLKSVGYDFWESSVAAAFNPAKDDEWWKRQRDRLLAAPLPLRSCNGFIPGKFRLTGPKADFAPALDYGEKALRRAEEVGVKTIVFGSGGARNVPGDFLSSDWPDVEKGARQYVKFCRELCSRVSDLKGVAVVIEPLRPNESNIMNFVWQGAAACREVASPRLRLLADIFHMLMGGETARSIVDAAEFLRHCHIASYGTRQFPGFDKAADERFAPYFAALKEIGYSGGVSCECSWGEKGDYARNLETALRTMKGFI